MNHETASFTFAFALGAGVAAHLAARHLRIPSIVLFLATGVALGPDGLGWITPRALGEGLSAFVSLAVAVILFEGGLGLNLKQLRSAATPVRRLVTSGALITVLGAGAAAYAILGWPLDRALLYGTLVIVTGPTVIRPLLRLVPVRSRLATVLEAEGLLIDPVGAIVAAVALEIVVERTLGSFASGALGLIARLAFGAGAGAAIGWILTLLLRARRVVPDGLENLVVLGGALTGFAVCELVLPESGILAVIVAAAILGNAAPQRARTVGEFQEHLTIALIGMLFVLLAADIRIATVLALGWPGVLTVAALATVVRPLGVLWATRKSELSLRERLFASWLGPRGVVAAAVASVVAGALDAIGAPGGPELRALVFLTIALTVVVLGGLAPIAAHVLKVRAPGRDVIAILGAEELGLELGHALRDSTRQVLFVDNNPRHCQIAEQQGFAVAFGDALAPTTRARLRLERARAAIGLTTNAELNHLFTLDAHAEYGVPELYVAATRARSEASSRLAARHSIRVLFDRPKDVERWNVRLRHGLAKRVRLRFSGAAGSAPVDPNPKSPDAFLVLAVRRGAWEPMHRDWVAKPGDEAIALIHGDEAVVALEVLRGMGWEVLREDAAPSEREINPP